MNPQLAMVLALLGIAILLFAVGRPRSDAVGLLVIVALPFTGVLTVSEALVGFSNPNIVLIAAMFVIGEGLTRAGVAQRLGDLLVRHGGTSEARLVALLMLIIGGLGSIMSNTGIVAIFIPVALRIAARAKIPPRNLLLPVAFAALVSGMLTLVATSSNLVINYELARNTGQGFTFFSFTPIGLSILLLVTVYWLFARRFLPKQPPDQSVRARRPRIRDWVKQYKLAPREYRVRIRAGSPLDGRRIDQVKMQLPEGTDARIVAIERQGRFARELVYPSPTTVLLTADVLLIDHALPTADIDALREQFKLDALPLTGAYFTDQSQGVGMVEVIVPAESSLVGKTVAGSELSSRYRLSAIGLRRGRAAIEQRISAEVLRVGDTLLLLGPWSAIRALNAELHELVVLNLPAEMDEVLPAAGRAPQALLATAVTVGLMVSGVVPNVHAALIGCLLMGLFRCIDLDSAYRIISWRTLIMIVGMMPFAIALQRTGGVDMAADGLIAMVGGASPHMALAVLFMVTVLLGMFMATTISALLMIPVALALAQALGLSPYPFAMIVALAASAAFMSPVTPVNALVVNAGNYSVGDFIRIGLPLTLMVMVTSVILVPLFFPL
jgi:di/tricarboxylate transporter